MFPRVERVRHVAEYGIELSFTDGTTREIDLKDRVVGRGGVFGPLQDVEFFKQVQVDSEAGTIGWPSLDFHGAFGTCNCTRRYLNLVPVVDSEQLVVSSIQS